MEMVLKGTNLVCSTCSKVFETIQKYRKHFQRAHGVKSNICPDCGKPFTLLNKLKVHMLSHNSIGEFLCSLCGKRFKRRDKLREHIIRMHLVEKGNDSIQTKAKERIKRYKFVKFQASAESSDYSNDVIKKSKSYKFGKLKPSEMGMGVAGYHCNFCDIEFNRRGILVNHMTRIHPEVPLFSLPQLNGPVLQPQKLFKCHYCEKAYQSNGGRKMHIRRNHPTVDHSLSNRFMDIKEVGYVEVTPKLCSQCPRQFLTNAKLLQHERKFHSKESL